MKFFQFSLFVLLFATFPEFSKGQNLKENELVIIQGEKFILHQVRTGETVFSISRDFKTESSILQKYNPSISEGLSIGQILKIPYNKNISLSEIPDLKKGDPTGFTSHTVESNNETAYSISKKYGITVEEIYAYNPTVQRLKKGMVLKIPQWEATTIPESATVQQISSAGNQIQADMLEHNVVSGETLYSISKKYQVSESDILQYNPEAKNLKAGSKLYIPKKPAENKVVDWVSESNVQVKYFNHTIVSGETLYGITQKYKVSEEEIKAINPELKFAFRAGAVIRIPVQATKESADKSDGAAVAETNNTQGKVNSSETYGKLPVDCAPETRIGDKGTTEIALFLPLFLETNEQLNKEFVSESKNTENEVEPIDQMATDTIIEHEKPVKLLKQFHDNSENFLQFYEGVLIAVDSMQKAGMKIVLNVFDTKDNPETVKKIKNTHSFSETDLIIGPVYENVQKEIEQISVQYKVPMISPFTPKSSVLDSNPYFYQINPTREYLAEATAELIASEYSNTNFIVVRTSSYHGAQENQFVELIRRKLSRPEISNGGKYTEYDFRKGRSHGLREKLMTDKENVVFLPSSDEGELSVAISNINNLAVDFPITLIGAGNYQQRYPSIEIAHFHNLKMKYINPYWIDYKKPETIKYFEKFIDNFGTEPNSYGVQGFDATWYFLNALLLYGKDFQDCLPYMKINLVQGNYYFKKVSQSGGYMNNGVSVISYTRNFDVERQSVFGQPQLKQANK
jgi:LysM repeat protein